MKKIYYLFIGATFLFFGCTEDTILVSETNQKSDEIISAKMERTSFTGTCSFVAPIDAGETKDLPFFMGLLKGQTSEWYDFSATEPRVTGSSFWTVNSKAQKNGNVTFWGKAELVVDDDLGVWDLSYHGWLKFYDGPPFAEMVVDATGVGKEGDIKGLVAKWTYRWNPFEEYYDTVGYVQSK